MPIERILILEDDLIVRKNLEQQLRQRRYDVVAVATLAAAQEQLALDAFDLMFVDVRLPDGEGTDLLRAVNQRAQRPLVVIVTGFGSVESAVECMRNGAFDYLIKPFTPDQFEITLRKAEEFTQLLKVNRLLNQEDEETGYELLGDSAAMENLRALLRRVGRTDATVLIQGESGTGKELVARMLYKESPRSGAPFIKINCAAVSESLIESEFFGHEKGAFTGALSKREGRFELAHGGTLLLDEISEISPAVQAKLLRVLQERTVRPVGGSTETPFDARVIAATNRDLEVAVEEKRFREDLYFRINVVQVALPPLRARGVDVLLLAQHFIARFAAREGKAITGLTAATAQKLMAYAWPGNVRELQNAMERAVALTRFAEISVEDLPEKVSSYRSSHVLVTSDDPSELVPLEEVERRYILKVVDAVTGNRSMAARILGLDRKTLRRKLTHYGVQGESEPPE